MKWGWVLESVHSVLFQMAVLETVIGAAILLSLVLIWLQKCDFLIYLATAGLIAMGLWLSLKQVGVESAGKFNDNFALCALLFIAIIVCRHITFQLEFSKTTKTVIFNNLGVAAAVLGCLSLVGPKFKDAMLKSTPLVPALTPTPTVASSAGTTSEVLAVGLQFAILIACGSVAVFVLLACFCRKSGKCSPKVPNQTILPPIIPFHQLKFDEEGNYNQIDDPHKDEYKNQVNHLKALILNNGQRSEYVHRSFMVSAPWGMGKTTIKNLLIAALKVPKNCSREFKAPIVVDLNVWRYSHKTNLLHDTISHIHKQVSEQLFWLNPYLRFLNTLASKFGSEKVLLEGTDAVEIMEEIDLILKNRNAYLVVVLDELDRIEPHEVNTVFKLTQVLKQVSRCCVVAFVALSDLMENEGRDSEKQSKLNADFKQYKDILSKFKKEFHTIEFLPSTGSESYLKMFYLFKKIRGTKIGAKFKMEDSAPNEEHTFYKDIVKAFEDIGDQLVQANYTYRDMERLAQGLWLQFPHNSDAENRNNLLEYLDSEQLTYFTMLKSWFPDIYHLCVSHLNLIWREETDQSGSFFDKEQKLKPFLLRLSFTPYFFKHVESHPKFNKAKGRIQPQIACNERNPSAALLRLLLLKLFPTKLSRYLKANWTAAESNRPASEGDLELTPNLIRATQKDWPSYLPTSEEINVFVGKVDTYFRNVVDRNDFSFDFEIPRELLPLKLSFLWQYCQYRIPKMEFNELAFCGLIFKAILEEKTSYFDFTTQIQSSYYRAYRMMRDFLTNYWVQNSGDNEKLKSFWDFWNKFAGGYANEPTKFGGPFLNEVLVQFLPISQNELSTWMWDDLSKFDFVREGSKSTQKLVSSAKKSLIYIVGERSSPVPTALDNVWKHVLNANAFVEPSPNDGMRDPFKVLLLWSIKYYDTKTIKKNCLELFRQMETNAKKRLSHVCFNWLCLGQLTLEICGRETLAGNVRMLRQLYDNSDKNHNTLDDLNQKITGLVTQELKSDAFTDMARFEEFLDFVCLIPSAVRNAIDHLEKDISQ